MTDKLYPYQEDVTRRMRFASTPRGTHVGSYYFDIWRPWPTKTLEHIAIDSIGGDGKPVVDEKISRWFPIRLTREKDGSMRSTK